MKKRNKAIGFLLLAIGLLHFQATAQQADTLRVLFVGNSYIYFHNLPQLVAAMGESQGVPIITRQATVGGSNLELHWKEKKDSQAKSLINSKKWDYVILNNHSLSTIRDPEGFDQYGKLFAELIQKNGAEPVFYLTWARKHNPLMQQTISEKYRALAEAVNAEVVPVGEMWMKSIELRPDLELYHPDGSHPSPEGTYLNALAFYRFLSGKEVAGVPDRLITKDGSGEKLYLSIIYPDTGDFLRDVVDGFTSKGGEDE